MANMAYQPLKEAPAVQEMRRTLAFFDNVPAISVQQTMRGCFQECFGCEASSEYRVFAGHVEEGQPRAEGLPQIGYLLEESPCILRACCGASRPFAMPFSVPDATGTRMLVFKKGWNLPICCVIPIKDADPLNCPCCCCLPRLENFAVSQGGSEAPIGSASYLCDVHLCVPKFMTYDASGLPRYLVRPETCCCDCCIVVRGCGGRQSRALYTPFYIRHPITGDMLPGAVGGNAHISKVWSGLKKECCSDADNFQIVFPAGSDSVDRANLLGATVLMDFAYFESQSTA